MGVSLWRSLLIDGLIMRCDALSYLLDTPLACGAVGNALNATIYELCFRSLIGSRFK